MSDARSTGEATPVNVTHHAAERWHARRKIAPGVGPKVAWEEATELQSTPTLDCDEARYHEPTDLVLVASQDYLEERLCIITTIRGDEAQWKLKRAIEEVTGDEEADVA